MSDFLVSFEHSGSFFMFLEDSFQKMHPYHYFPLMQLGLSGAWPKIRIDNLPIKPLLHCGNILLQTVMNDLSWFCRDLLIIIWYSMTELVNKIIQWQPAAWAIKKFSKEMLHFFRISNYPGLLSGRHCDICDIIAVQIINPGKNRVLT